MPSFLSQLPSELWDLILSFLSKININITASSRLLSDYFNELVLNNRNVKCKLLLAKGKVLFDSVNSQFRWACYSGHLEVAKYLVESFGLTGEDIRDYDNFAFRYSCTGGHLEVAKWLVETFKITATDIKDYKNRTLYWSHRYGHVEVVKWLEDTFYATI